MTKGFKSKEQLFRNLEKILQSPKNNGVVKMIVRRPEINSREVIEKGQLSVSSGLVGDSWKKRAESKLPEKIINPNTQITIMNARVIDHITDREENWPLAGDQLFVDLELSEENLPHGTKLSFGLSEIEITKVPHMGCGKFKNRFGSEALKFINSEIGKKHHFRGIYAKVIKAGEIKKGDVIIKLNN